MIGDSSRYAGSVLYVDGNDEFIGGRSRIDTSFQTDDIFHLMRSGDRIDLLAYRYLGDPTLWWLICDYNDIFLPLELEPGRVLRLPSIEQVEMRILG